MNFFVVGLLLLIQLFLLVNLQFTAWPEVLSFPYLRNNGFLLYTDMVHPYPPVLTMFLALLYNLFGYEESVLKIFTWSLILFSGVLVFILTKRIAKNNLSGYLALGFYVFLQPLLEGNMLWFDGAMVAPLLLGAIFLLDRRYLAAGIFLALAGFIKQTGGLFYLVFLIYVLLNRTSWKDVRNYLVGLLLFGTFFIVRLLQEDALRGFFDWVIIYPSFYWTKFPNYVQMLLSKSQMFITALLVMPIVFWRKKAWNTEFYIVLIFIFLSLISVYPRFSFFHMQSLIAFSAVVFGAVFFQVVSWRRLFMLFIPLTIFWKILPVTRLDWGRETRFLTSSDKSLAREISSTTSSKKIFLQGLNSNQYVLTKTLPPKPWLDNFGWYWEIPGVKTETLARWELDPPETIYWRNPNLGNWYDLGVYQPDEVVSYIKEKYVYESDLNKEIEIWRRKD